MTVLRGVGVGVGLAVARGVGVGVLIAVGVGEGGRAAVGRGDDTGTRVAVGTGVADGGAGVAGATVGEGTASPPTTGDGCTVGVGADESEHAMATIPAKSNHTQSVPILNMRAFRSKPSGPQPTPCVTRSIPEWVA